MAMVATELADIQAKLEAVLEGLTFREQLNVLLRIGVPAEDIMGLPDCTDHRGATELHPHAPLTFDGHTMWCKGCWKWWSL